MSTWLSKMNNGGIRGGMNVKEPIVPGLNNLQRTLRRKLVRRKQRQQQQQQKQKK